MRTAILPFVVALFALSPALRLDAATRVALIEADNKQTGPIVALVEAQITGAAKLELVERPQIEKLLAEKQLQAALTAEDVAGRTALGKLLQADLLVFLQQHDTPEPHLQVIISETHQGLRLIRGRASPADAEKAAEAVDKLIARAVERAARPIREIFAVPPLVSDDLGFAYDYLKQASARVIESVLDEQPDVLVVELSEARALAKEIALAGGADARRPLPLYVVGSYRNSVVDQKQHIRVSLRLLRGETELATASREGLTPDELVGFLRSSASEFLKASGAQQQADADPKVEAAQLAERAQLMIDLGSWQEAPDLIEASLLLNPDQPELHREAVRALREFINRACRAPKAQVGQQPGVSPLVYFERAMEHLEPYLRATKVDYERDSLLVGEIFGSIDRWGDDHRWASVRQKQFTPEYQAFMDAHGRALDMYVRALDEKIRNKTIDGTARYLTLFDSWKEADPVQKRDLHLKALADLTYLPDEGSLLPSYLVTIEPEPEDIRYRALLPSYSEFLHKARELPNDSLKHDADIMLEMVEHIRQRYEREQIADKKPLVKRPPVKSEPDDEVIFAPLEFKFDNTPGGESHLPIMGWMQAGKNTDLVWSLHGMFVMKQPGVLRFIDARDQNARGVVATHPCFDGRYAWIARRDRASKGGKQHLLVVDPEAETIFEIGTQHQLPECTALQVTPLAPGRALVVGYLGHTFAAIVDFEAPNKASVEIIHEFRTVPNEGDKEQWRNPDLAFPPGALFTLSEISPDGTLRQAGLVWRMVWAQHEIIQHPLIIDLPSGNVRPLEQGSVLSDWSKMAAHDGVVDMLDVKVPGTTEESLRRFSLSGISFRELPKGSHNPRLFEWDGRLHWVDSGWLVAPEDAGPFRSLKAHLPLCFDLSCADVGLSNHYGPLLLARERGNPGRDQDFNVYRVKFK